MKATKEQIIAEANRRHSEQGEGAPPVEHFIVDVVCENWTPPEPVDPDILAWREWFAERHPSLKATTLEGDWDGTSDAQAFLAGARMARAEKLSLLNWLSDQKSLEVSWVGDPDENGAWRVYRVTGGFNYREWHLIATGETPLAALKNARDALAKYRGETR